jgi:predicted small lipoprotein YifL
MNMSDRFDAEGMTMLLKLARVTLVICMAGVVVTGCGRKGTLDRPSTPVEEQNQRHKSKAAPPVPDKPFVLDPLL